jgi:hypothetical protein
MGNSVKFYVIGLIVLLGVFDIDGVPTSVLEQSSKKGNELFDPSNLNL